MPFLAKLGDMFGHKRILLISTVLTALATWALAFSGDFTTYLIAFALQGFYVVWLPLEVALIFDRGRRTGRSASQTRRAAGFLVVALEAGAIAGDLAGGNLIDVFRNSVPLTLVVPAIAVTLVFFAILFGVPESEPLPGRSLDAGGFVLLTIGLLLITGGLAFLRIAGPGAWWVYAMMLAGVLVFVPWTLFELRRPDPAVDIRCSGDRTCGPSRSRRDWSESAFSARRRRWRRSPGPIPTPVPDSAWALEPARS